MVQITKAKALNKWCLLVTVLLLFSITAVSVIGYICVQNEKSRRIGVATILLTAIRYDLDVNKLLFDKASPGAEKIISQSVIHKLILVRSFVPDVNDVSGAQWMTVCRLVADEGKALLSRSGDDLLSDQALQYLSQAHARCLLK